MKLENYFHTLANSINPSATLLPSFCMYVVVLDAIHVRIRMLNVSRTQRDIVDGTYRYVQGLGTDFYADACCEGSTWKKRMQIN
jgi:hypothetical protein